MQRIATAPSRLARSAAWFIGIGIVLYIGLLAVAERIMDAHGEMNPMWRIAAEARAGDDWVVLGSSHALPLAFGGFEEEMKRDTGLSITTLAQTGAGPLYNRFVFEQYLRRHRTSNLLYVVDGFAFYSREWNEERFADSKLLSRTPWDARTAAALGRYVMSGAVSWRVWLDYVTGFSKINNADRFKPDRWDAASQFDREWRPSTFAVKSRIKYLYPAGTDGAALERYAVELERVIQAARASGARVVLVKLPLTAQYAAQLPGEAQFDAAMERIAGSQGAAWIDLSRTLQDPKLFFDSDHLNRRGVRLLYEKRLKEILVSGDPRLAQ